MFGKDRLLLVEESDLPNVTPEETLAVLTAEAPLAVSFFGTDKGREMLRRAYFSCAHTNAELGEMFGAEAKAISAFISKQGWPAERDKSRKEGEIAADRERLRAKIDEAKWDILEVAQKGIAHLKDPDIDGEAVLAAAKNFRSLTQSITDLMPKDETKSAINNSIINIGSQVAIVEE